MHLTAYPRYALRFVGVLISLLCHAAVAQVCATPGNDAATTSMAVGALDTAGNSTPIAPGDLLMVIQMQGAEINSSNSDCYGAGAGAAGCATRTETSASYAGGSTSYTVTFTNSGASAADAAVAKDTPSAGLACTVQSCTASSAPIPAVCPAAALWPNLLSPAGVALPALPALGSISFVLTCDVTATGQ